MAFQATSDDLGLYLAAVGFATAPATVNYYQDFSFTTYLGFVALTMQEIARIAISDEDAPDQHLLFANACLSLYSL